MENENLEFFFKLLCSVTLLERLGCTAHKRIPSLEAVKSNISAGFDHLFHDENCPKKIHTHHTPTQKKYKLYVWRENETEKPCRQFTADLPWWNNAAVCKKREPWSTQSTRGPWTTENCFAGNQSHICRRRHHKDIYIRVSEAGVTSSSTSSSKALTHWQCSERFKEFEALVPCGTSALFSSTRKNKIKYCVTIKVQLYPL